jgi:hypothetical protein
LAGAVVTAEGPGTTVKGVVRVEGEVPAPPEWEVDGIMRRAIGDKVYRAETWLVGAEKGLANCVVTLRPKSAANKVTPKPLQKAILDKVGVRYAPRVLVVTPGTEVTLRNKESPCRGFYIEGGPGRGNSYGHLVPEGREQKITLVGPDVCEIRCPARPYVRGYVLVVDTPHFAVTDKDGKFAIRNLPAGEYLVSVWHEAGGRKTKVEGPTEVRVTAKGDTTLALRVKPPEGAGKWCEPFR